MPHAANPTPEQLAAFAAGRLGDAQARAVAAHLCDCAACRQAAGRPRAATVVGHAAPSRPSPSPAQTPLPGGAAAATPTLPADVPPELCSHPRYRVLRELGRGGMGVVYQAEQTMMDRPVAIKVISREVLSHPDALERFRREIKTAAKLNHPNVVIAYDAEQVGDLHMLVMEFVEGQSLDRVLHKKGPLQVPHACHFIRQAALGLQQAAELGMVHRDIKPHNLMLTAKGQVKILDFGLAKVVSESGARQSLTASSAYMGTPEYCAPEQAADARQADIRADIYSLGCTLYAVLAGAPPFQEDTAVLTILAHMGKEPRPLPELRPDVPPELWAVVARMLAKDPAQRYQTPAEVAQALAPFCKKGERPAATPAATPIRVPPNRQPTRTAQAVSPLPARSAQAVAVASPFEELTDAPARPAQPATIRRPAGRGTRWGVLAGGAAAAVVLLGVGAWLAASHFFPRKAPAGAGLTAAPGEGPRAAKGGGSVFTEGQNAPVAQDGKTGEVLEYAHYTGPVWCVAISPDGSLGLCGGGAVPGGAPYPGADYAVHLIDLRTGNLERRFTGHTQNVRAVAFCPDGNHFISGSWDKTLRLWDVKTGEELFRFEGHEGPVSSLAISRDGRFMISGADKDNTVHVWDVVQRVEVGWLRGNTSGIECVALSADGRLALSGSSDRTVRLWNVPWRQELHRFDDFTNLIGGVGFLNGDEDVIAGTNYSDAEQVLRRWDVATARPAGGFAGQTGGVKSLAVSADGRRVLTGNQDGTVRLWDAAGGQELQRFPAHGAPAFVAVALSADGKWGLSGGSDQVVKLWRLPPADAGR